MQKKKKPTLLQAHFLNVQECFTCMSNHVLFPVDISAPIYFFEWVDLIWGTQHADRKKLSRPCESPLMHEQWIIAPVSAALNITTAGWIKTKNKKKDRYTSSKQTGFNAALISLMQPFRPWTTCFLLETCNPRVLFTVVMTTTRSCARLPPSPVFLWRSFSASPEGRPTTQQKSAWLHKEAGWQLF